MVVKAIADTINFLPKNSKKEVTYSKRDVAKVGNPKRNEPKQGDMEKTDTSRQWEARDESSEDETHIASEEDKSTMTDNPTEAIESAKEVT